MTSETTTITLPIPPDAAMVLGLAVAILIASGGVFAVLPRDEARNFKSPLRRIAEGLGFHLNSASGAALLFLAMLGYVALFAMAMVIALRLLGGVTVSPLGGDGAAGQETSFGFGALLAAILGAPFIIWRSWIAAKQAAISEEALFNEKVNTAARDLAARSQVTRIVGRGAQQRVLTEWQDNLITRAAAIDRLEGLALEAIERGDYVPAQRIARMLSAYVQALSLEHPAKDAPEYESGQQMQIWAATLRSGARPDMERAVQSLGRINPTDKSERAAFDPTNINLRRCNLQGYDLNGLNYQSARLCEAHMQGARMDKASLQLADLEKAKMQGAKLVRAKLQGADLRSAECQGTVFAHAEMHGANLSSAKMQEAMLHETMMLGANLDHTVFSEDTYMSSRLRGALVWGVSNPTLVQLKRQWDEIFVFGGKLPEGAPAHWIQSGNHADDRIIGAWRAWAATLNPPVTIAPDYHR